VIDGDFPGLKYGNFLLIKIVSLQHRKIAVFDVNKLLRRTKLNGRVTNTKSKWFATISWCLPIIMFPIGIYISSNVQSDHSKILIALSLLLVVISGLVLGIYSIFQYKQNTNLSMLIQAIVGILFNLVILIVCILSAVANFESGT